MTKSTTEPIPSPSNLYIPWTKPEAYPKMISDANQRYNFGIPKQNIERLESALETYEHLDDYTPCSVRMWLRGNLKNNWEKMFLWLSDGIKTEGFQLGSFIHAEDLLYYDDKRDGDFYKHVKGHVKCELIPRQAHIHESSKLVLTPIRLNLGGFLATDTYQTNNYWGGLELLTFLALNPQVFKLLDGQTLPYLCANGLRTKDGFVPIFRFNDDEECLISGHWFNTKMNFKKEADPFLWDKAVMVSST